MFDEHFESLQLALYDGPIFAKLAGMTGADEDGADAEGPGTLKNLLDKRS